MTVTTRLNPPTSLAEEDLLIVYMCHHLSREQNIMENKLVTEQGMQVPATYFHFLSLWA